MKTIDKLIIKAKKRHGVYRLVNAFIYPSETEPGKWVVDGRVWNGVPCSGVKQLTFTCESVDDAKNVLDEMSKSYPNTKDICVYINDIEE